MAQETTRPKAAPGWYPTQHDATKVRYWDGQRWTDQFRPAPPATPAPAPADASNSEGGATPARKGFWASLAPDPDVLAAGPVDNTTTMRVYRDGTFVLKPTFGRESTPDRLLGFDHDIDSMRRKSTTGRGAAALITGGASLLASNNRGVVYVTVTGEQTAVRTFTTRNPSGTTLTAIRSLKAAADAVIAQHRGPATAPASGADAVAQLKQLADLHAAGALTDAEFTAAKARLLA